MVGRVDRLFRDVEMTAHFANKGFKTLIADMPSLDLRTPTGTRFGGCEAGGASPHRAVVELGGGSAGEAGAAAVTELALTLANGFHYAEAYRARGMDVNAFVRNFSFFFSNGMDPEYGVMGRVARRIWAIAMRDMYGAGERAQKFKYHIQSSGRSLHGKCNFSWIRSSSSKTSCNFCWIR